MKTSRILLINICFIICQLSFSQTVEQTEKPLAFPGAEGFGRYTTGGRGGKVYHVTNLKDDGSRGTLRWACQQQGPRTIVFDVSGTIQLTSRLNLLPNTTLAGQTAPGDGICIAGYQVSLGKNNIIRYLRFRPGDENEGEHDGLGAMDSENIIVDHCSVSWSVDECLSVYGSKNITVQWCISSQSLLESQHVKGSHGMGGNWGGSGATYHHNLMAHHAGRTPRLGPRPYTQTDERMDMRNNVIYNWTGLGCYGGEGMNVNIVNNYYKPGPGTPEGTAGMRIAMLNIRDSEYTGHYTAEPNVWDVMWHVWGKFYVVGNVNAKYSQVTDDNWTYGIYNQIRADQNDGTYTQKTRDTIRLAEPIGFRQVTTHTAQVAYEKVLRYVGASLHRDRLDSVIVSDTRLGKATFTAKGKAPGMIDHPSDVTGMGWDKWPPLASGSAQQDSDGDGMPDSWETANGLDPNDGSDGNAMTLSGEGYTNVEVYMNAIVAHITEAQNEDGILEGSTERYDPYEGEVGMPFTDIDLTSGEIDMAADGKNRAVILNGKCDYFSHNDHLTFKLYNETEGTYNVTFQAATTRNDFKLRFTLTDQNTGQKEVDRTVSIANTGDWQSYRRYSFITDNITTGHKKLDLTFLSTAGQVTGNMYNLSLQLREAADIRTIRPAEPGTQQYYDLQGRRVRQLKPGIYIVGNKKICVQFDTRQNFRQ